VAAGACRASLIEKTTADENPQWARSKMMAESDSPASLACGYAFRGPRRRKVVTSSRFPVPMVSFSPFLLVTAIKKVIDRVAGGGSIDR
jgi:hypothetical protein